MLRFLLLLAVAIGVAAPIFLSARDRARQSARTRARLIVGGVAGVACGLLAALWLPHVVPQTQGSPATIVAIILLWIVGGGFAFLSLAMVIGALAGRRRADPSLP